MRARDVVGRRIVAVRQQRFVDRFLTPGSAVALDAIVLDNDAVIAFAALESAVEPYVHAQVIRGRAHACAPGGGAGAASAAG